MNRCEVISRSFDWILPFDIPFRQLSKRYRTLACKKGFGWNEVGGSRQIPGALRQPFDGAALQARGGNDRRESTANRRRSSQNVLVPAGAKQFVEGAGAGQDPCFRPSDSKQVLVPFFMPFFNAFFLCLFHSYSKVENTLEGLSIDAWCTLPF